MKKEKDTEGHFDAIADTYDSMNVKQWDEKEHAWQMNHIKNQLSLTSDDVILEIGAGTGKDSNFLRNMVGSKLPWVAMDPSQKMCDISCKYPGLIVRKSTGQQALATLQAINPPHPPNKVLMKYCAQYLYDELPKLAKDFFNYLPSGGSVLIVTQANRCGLPFFEKAIQSFLATVRDPKELGDVFEEAGFKVTVEIVYYETKVTRKFWNEFLRNRVYSTLANFTDEEIEKGIKELDSKYGSDSDLPILDDETFVLATKL